MALCGLALATNGEAVRLSQQISNVCYTPLLHTFSSVTRYTTHYTCSMCVIICVMAKCVSCVMSCVIELCNELCNAGCKMMWTSLHRSLHNSYVCNTPPYLGGLPYLSDHDVPLIWVGYRSLIWVGYRCLVWQSRRSQSRHSR